MFFYNSASETRHTLFSNPFSENLNPKNRWVVLEKILPWDDMAQVFLDQLSDNTGRPSKNLRVVLGALFIKHIENLSDERTILAIQENIYMQYFVGLPGFTTEPVFDPSLFVYIRRRLGNAGAEKLNDIMIEYAIKHGAIKHTRMPRKANKEQSNTDNNDAGSDNESQHTNNEPSDDDNNGKQNKGTLKLDATVAPQNITYPTDVKVLSECRLKSEQLIDKLYEVRKSLWKKKPRTYRRKAQKQFVVYSKKRRKNHKDNRKMQKKQINYLKRNCGIIADMLEKLEAHRLELSFNQQDWTSLEMILKVLDQQTEMYYNGKRSVPDRIVSLQQYYVRPIKRGKAGKDTEFGAKIHLSETEGFVTADLISFDNFNEGIRLIPCLKAYKDKYGYYPQVVLVDQIYLTRKNRKFLKANGIEHRGTQVGRPPQKSESVKRREKKERNQRNTIEGQFGVAKTRYGLEKIKMKTEQTSYAAIQLILLAMNAIKLSKSFILALKSQFYGYLWSLRKEINKIEKMICKEMNNYLKRSHFYSENKPILSI
ncbi:MAG TPA: IS5 family transposase [Saprospiraceae bacterium]|nr:IS5 family transposase [Saprospiraceae bacterium]